MRRTCLALACVLLASTLLVGITASAPYDPWCDLDEDGRISIFDVVQIAASYGTLGDPGKNVTVTNWPSPAPYCEAQVQYMNVSWLGYDAYDLLPVTCGGFSRLYVYATVDSAVTGTYSFNVSLYAVQWNPGGLPSYYEYRAGDFLWFSGEISGSSISVPVQLVGDGITVKASQCILYFYLESDVPSGWINLRVTPYLRNE
ncbi:MAG: hypothetical protein WCC63_07590, partial [Candidatus Bathyarchaeia archaeon]